jgi:indole-3-glycerol phosphate synthase
MIGLSAIVERKQAEVAAAKARLPIAELEARLDALPACRGFAARLSRRGGLTRVVAEIKRASPSAGVIGRDLEIAGLVRTYRDRGASAISVLTDGVGFAGSLDDLRAVRGEVDVPLLRKDFIVDRYQLLEARCAGADAVLLIVRALAPAQLQQLHDEAVGLGLEVLVEAHDEAEVELANSIAGVRLMGLNSRNLDSFEVDLATIERLAPMTRPDVVVIAESGIREPADVSRLRAAGLANFLVGEALVRSSAPGALLAELLGTR